VQVFQCGWGNLPSAGRPCPDSDGHRNDPPAARCIAKKRAVWRRETASPGKVPRPDRGDSPASHRQVSLPAGATRRPGRVFMRFRRFPKLPVRRRGVRTKATYRSHAVSRFAQTPGVRHMPAPNDGPPPDNSDSASTARRSSALASVESAVSCAHAPRPSGGNDPPQPPRLIPTWVLVCSLSIGSPIRADPMVTRRSRSALDGECVFDGEQFKQNCAS